jgi:hypothetical protein
VSEIPYELLTRRIKRLQDLNPKSDAKAAREYLEKELIPLLNKEIKATEKTKQLSMSTLKTIAKYSSNSKKP